MKPHTCECYFVRDCNDGCLVCTQCVYDGQTGKLIKKCTDIKKTWIYKITSIVYDLETLTTEIQHNRRKRCKYNQNECICKEKYESMIQNLKECYDERRENRKELLKIQQENQKDPEDSEEEFLQKCNVKDIELKKSFIEEYTENIRDYKEKLKLYYPEEK